jgi:hypothetical protein
MSKISIIGYHGTEIRNVDKILRSEFVSIERPDHWLGQGIYFYEDLSLAKWWAEKKFKRVYSQAAVVQVEILVDDSNLLNLDSKDGMDKFFREIKKILHKSTISFKFEDDRRTENFCFALDLLKGELGISVIIRSFLRHSPSYGEQNINVFEKDFFNLPHDFAYLEKQICVSINENIKSKQCIYPPRRTTWS